MPIHVNNVTTVLYQPWSQGSIQPVPSLSHLCPGSILLAKICWQIVFAVVAKEIIEKKWCQKITYKYSKNRKNNKSNKNQDLETKETKKDPEMSANIAKIAK